MKNKKKNRSIYQALIIDDEPDAPKENFDDIVKPLKDEGYELYAIEDPWLVPSQPNDKNLKKVDFILLDLHFPDQNAYGPVKFLYDLWAFNVKRENNFLVPIPVIIYSSFKEIDEIQKNSKNFLNEYVLYLIPKNPIRKKERMAMMFAIQRVCNWIAYKKLSLGYFKEHKGDWEQYLTINKNITGWSPEEIQQKKKKEKPPKNSKIIGKSRPMIKLLDEIKLVAMTDHSILISGDSGVGKELIANQIHYQSKRRDKEIFAFNCASLASSIAYSDLFGHKRGAFTGGGD